MSIIVVVRKGTTAVIGARAAAFTIRRGVRRSGATGRLTVMTTNIAMAIELNAMKR